MNELDLRHSSYSERVSVTGRFHAGAVVGTYTFSCGRADNYLELHAANGQLAMPAAEGLRQLADDLSVRPFAGGAGLGVLETTSCTLQSRDTIDRLNALLLRIRSEFPDLRLCDADDDVQDDFQSVDPPGESGPVAAHCATIPTERPSDSEPPTWMQLAGQAVAEGRFKSAERLARQHCAGGHSEAAEFLEALTAVRRAAKLVRRHPRSADAYLALAQAYFLADAGTAALQAARRAVVLDPNMSEAHAVAGLELLFCGDCDGARAHLRAAQHAGRPGLWTQGLTRQLQDRAAQTVLKSRTLPQRQLRRPRLNACLHWLRRSLSPSFLNRG